MAILLERGLSPSYYSCIDGPRGSCMVTACVTSLCECYCRVQMSDLSSFQTTSFHTRLSFLDEENDDSLLEDDEEDEDDEDHGEDYYYCGLTGR